MIFLRSVLLFLILSSSLLTEPLVVSSTNFGPIEFTVLQNGESNRRYIWLHGDEKTAKMALEYHISKYHGTAFLIRNEERVIRIDGLRLDPNRIFSSLGIRNTIIKYHPDVSKNKRSRIIEVLNNERDLFLEQLLSPNDGLVVALHNNSRGYSIDSELDMAEDYSVKSDQNRHDLFLCTDKRDFEILALSPFNAVLQNNQSEDDDGSLSKLMGRKGYRYINIEVRLGWLSQQKKMLKFLENNIP